MSALLAIAFLAACDEDPPDPTADASADAAPPPRIELELPAEPAPPVFTPCPDGWSERVIDDLVVCEPYPDGRRDCDVGEVHLPGEPGCARIGSACPADGFPASLPEAPDVRFVRAGARGTGTRSAPYGAIGEALAAVALEGLVVVAPGTYREDLVLTRPVTLLGACASETVVEGRGSEVAVIGVEGAFSTVRDLTVRGGRYGIHAQFGALVVAEDVVVQGFGEGGLVAHTSLGSRRATSTSAGAAIRSLPASSRAETAKRSRRAARSSG